MGRKRSAFQHDTWAGGSKEVPESRRSRMSAVQESSTRESSTSAEGGARAGATQGEEAAAIKIQTAARGKLARDLKLFCIASNQQHAAVERLRAQRRESDPGKGELPPESGVLRDGRRRSVRAVHC